MYCGWGSGFIHGNSSRALLHPPANNSWYAYAYRHCTGTKLFICTPPPSRFWSSSAAPLLLLLHLQHSLLRLFKHSTNVQLHYLFNPTFTTAQDEIKIKVPENNKKHLKRCPGNCKSTYRTLHLMNLLYQK